MAIHALSTLMTDDPAIVEAALSEVLADPVAPPRVVDEGESLGFAAPAPAPHRAPPRSAPAHLPAARDRCPDSAASPLDRIELALYLIGDRSCATVSRTLGLPERSIAGRLSSGLWVLFTVCDGATSYSPQGRLPSWGH
ncbi:hypothetical protein [Streptomyces melanogenes]|uniref:hypothetical protein n=1 Tax=Streptomyces melanogenes TaxID=67326 RepID=UPI003787369C